MPSWPPGSTTSRRRRSRWNRQRHRPAFAVRLIDRREHFDDDTAFFAADQRPPPIANRFDEIADLQSVVVNDRIDLLKAGPVLRLKLREETLFAGDRPD